MKINIVILYGGSQPAPAQQAQTSSQTVAPWAPIQPYLKQGYKAAAELYAKGPAEYTPFSQAAKLTSNQLAHINGVNEYVNSPGTQKYLTMGANALNNSLNDSNNPYNSTSNQVQPMLAGYLQNNNLNDVSQGLNHFMYSGTNDPMLQVVISNGVSQVDNALKGIRGSLQNKYGFSENLAKNTADIARNSSINQALMSGFDTQNNNRLSAIDMANKFNNSRFGMAADLLINQGDYSNNNLNMGLANMSGIMTTPLSMLDQLNQAGGTLQDQNQAQILDATNRWNFNQQAPYDVLAKYMAAINPDKAWGNQYTSQNGSNSAAGTSGTSNAIGAGVAGLGLLNSAMK